MTKSKLLIEISRLRRLPDYGRGDRVAVKKIDVQINLLYSQLNGTDVTPEAKRVPKLLSQSDEQTIINLRLAKQKAAAVANAG